MKNVTQYTYRFSSAKIQCKAAGCMVGRSCHLPVFRKGESDAQIRQDIPTSKEFGSDMQFSPRRSFQQHQDHAVDHRCQCPEGNDRPGHGEHLDRRAGDDALWLCQDRHTVFSEFFQLPPKWAAYCFSLPLQMQTRSKYAYLSQSLLKGTHEPALQNF